MVFFIFNLQLKNADQYYVIDEAEMRIDYIILIVKTLYFNEIELDLSSQ